MADKYTRAVDAFERAVEDKAFEGTIPVFSDDREEQQALDAAHKRIQTNYTRARNRLLALLSAATPD